ALAELQCLYLHKVKECDCLAQKLLKQTESVSKEVHNELLQHFAKVEKHLISLEIALQKCKEQVKNNTVWNEKASNVFQKEHEEYIKIQDLKAQLQDKNIAIKGLSKAVTAQTLPQTARQVVSNTNVLKPRMYRINKTTQTRASQSLPTVRNSNPLMSTSTGVNHKTNVSRPHHKSNQLKDKVLPNNSQVRPKKTQVKEHPRISSISNKTKSVTTCNDSLNSRTSNANAVCASCDKCLVDSNHFACVTKMLNDVKARTKKLNVVPISTRKPKSHANKPVATPHKKKVASKPTNQKPQSYFRMMYQKTRKIWKWWIEQLSPSGYKCHQDINGVYYVEGLNHNHFSVGQFCDANLKVAFQKSKYFVRDLQGNDLLTTLPTQAWLWHQRHSHLNFDYINLLSKKDVVIGLPKLKYVKDHLCSSCELSKEKRSSFKSKAVPSSKGRLNLLHMDLCGPMRVVSINGKKYIMVIVDDYSRYTWTLFLRFKDETPEVLKEFLTMIQRNLQALVITVQTDRGTKFLNKTLNAFFKEEGIEHQTSTARTPEHNGVVERQNRTLVEAAILSASKLPLFFWAEAIATACYTQNQSIIILTHEKTAYHIINDRKPSIKHLHIFSCICYITKDGENLDKMKEKGDMCIMVGYSTQSKGHHVYNKRTRMIVESIHICFDEIKEVSETSVANDTSCLVPQQQKASDYDNSDPVPQLQNVSSLEDAHLPSQ
nr:retrovirus-related Pol polyprotein from transposon TNT 1-94 [Tanacetum cinerariifolium]